MSNYTTNVSLCRIDIWRASGKWYTTEYIKFLEKDFNNFSIHDALENALKNDDHCKTQYIGMRITCLEPYHRNSHPISIIWLG